MVIVPFIEGYNAPFIFSNFNGTSADVDVLTHEAGHAFEVYTAAPAMPIPSMVFPTMEIAEIPFHEHGAFCLSMDEGFLW